MGEIKVTVILITYNQSQYITQAMDSILQQATDFKWELLVGNDASTDDTKEKLSVYPSSINNCEIHIYNRTGNMGASANLIDLIYRARGDYITVLEGDDYWLTDRKIQTLASFLDVHQDYVAVSHKRERRKDGVFVAYDPKDNLLERDFLLSDYAKGFRFSAMACMFRNYYKNIPENKGKDLFCGARNACDQVMCYSMLFQGKLYLLNEVFGVYRISSSSNSYCSLQPSIDKAKDYIEQNKRIMEHYGFFEPIEKEIVQFYISIIRCCIKELRFIKAISYFRLMKKDTGKGVLFSIFGKKEN